MAENNDGDESAQQQHRVVRASVRSSHRYGATAAVPRGKAITAAVSFFLYGFWTASVKTREPSLDCEDNIPMSKKREREREREREAEYYVSPVSPSKSPNASRLGLNVSLAQNVPNMRHVARLNITCDGYM